MPDIEQKFSYLFSVEDMASPAVARAEAAINTAVGNLGTQIEEFSGSAEAVAGIAEEAVAGVQAKAEEATGAFDTFVGGMVDALDWVSKLSVGLGTTAVGAVHKVTDSLSVLGATLSGLGRQIGGPRAGLIGQLSGALLGGLGNLFGGEGLMGFLLGPIAPVLKLLSPLINVVTKTLQPAFDAFGEIAENAFAPLSFLAETFVQSMAPQIIAVLSPISGILEQMLVMLGTQLQDAFRGIEAGAGPIFQAMEALFPVAQRVIGSLVTAAQKVLPVILKAVTTMLPIVMQLVEIVAGAFADKIELIADVVAEVGPELVELTGELLVTLIPLVAEIVKLGLVLTKTVFAPLLIKTLKLITPLIRDAIPYVELFTKAFSIGLDKLTTQLDDFFTNFQGYVDQFYALFIDPIITPIESAVKHVAAIFSAEGLAGGVVTLIERAATKLGSVLIGPVSKVLNPLLDWDPPLIPGGTIGQILGIPKLAIPELAEGALATGGRAVAGVFGEAGPELVTPVTQEALERVVEPIIAEVDVMGMEQVLGYLADLRDLVRGTLAVRLVGRPSENEGGLLPPREGGVGTFDLGMALGTGGLEGSGGSPVPVV